MTSGQSDTGHHDLIKKATTDTKWTFGDIVFLNVSTVSKDFWKIDNLTCTI